MEEKIGGISIEEIVGAATDDLNGKTSQGAPRPGNVPQSGTLCLRCGEPMPGEFCIKCGWSESAAPSAKTCANCGSPMEANDVFCGECGWKVGVTVQKEFCPQCGSVVVNGSCRVCQGNVDDNSKGWVKRFKKFRNRI